MTCMMSQWTKSGSSATPPTHREWLVVIPKLMFFFFTRLPWNLDVTRVVMAKRGWPCNFSRTLPFPSPVIQQHQHVSKSKFLLSISFFLKKLSIIVAILLFFFLHLHTFHYNFEKIIVIFMYLWMLKFNIINW